MGRHSLSTNQYLWLEDVPTAVRKVIKRVNDYAAERGIASFLLDSLRLLAI
ncbi:MAG: hypothetical protein GX564_11500 [Oligosphaeraceae bacterium]|nr:hypothetical protein [Oligosphaeraceae bacterium]